MGTAPGDLADRFDIPGVATVVEGNGEMQKVCITSAQATGEMYLHGAHVTSWKPADTKEVLFVSSKSRWENGRAIRGGVPICFPWFGGKVDDPNAPAHGVVRTREWGLESIAQVGNSVAISMFTESDEETARWWPGKFRVNYRVTFGTELTLELMVTNTGNKPFRFEEALHAYYLVGNILETRVKGLHGIEFIDKTDGNRKKVQNGEIAVNSESDRVYLDTTDAVEIEDAAFHRRTRVEKENSRTTVVWNPWVVKANSLPDFADNEWMRMICIEVSNVSDFGVNLAGGQQHKMTARIKAGGY
jgi:glucose-6-phosphate 1-epimerase